MRIIISCILLLLCGKSYEQEVTAPPVFNYQRDFRAFADSSKDSKSSLYYQKLLKHFLANDDSLNRRQMLALMIGFTETPQYKPTKNLETEKEIFDLNESGDYDEALAQSKTYLDKNPLSLRILKERSYTYHQLRKEDSAKYFMKMVEKIMGAMNYSGKGKTPDNPIFSLGLIDGEHFLRNGGLEVAHTSTSSPKSKVLMYTVDGMNDEGVHTNYYFILQHAREKMDMEDDEEIGEAEGKKLKKGNKKGKKENKKLKNAPVTDSIPVAH